MRIVISGVLGGLISIGSVPSFAQNILRTEPLVLAPYEMVLVQDGSCSPGKILRVTGAIRGLRRKKSCILSGGSQASLGLIQ